MFSKIVHGFVAIGLVVGLCGCVQARGNSPLRVNVAEPYDAGLFTPQEHLNLLSSSEFTSLGHPAFPNYNVRIKKSTDFCDGTVNAYTGYIDIEARHLFFYFFESRSDPSKDDVIFWTNGGPGCSSSLGLFMELGPCRVTQPNATTFNPFSWNENANIFFVDQPIGVGFSYADYGEYVSSTEEAAKDIASFVAIFFEHFIQFKGRAFHMAGESYGGKYVPAFAAHVYDQNAKLVQAGIAPINLTSVMIGNGCTEDHGMYPAYYEMQCSVVPIQDIGTCVQMKRAVSSDHLRLLLSVLTFRREGYNPYDMSQLCDGAIEDTLCYPVTKQIATFLDRPDIRQQLGVDPSLTANFSSCSGEVGNRFVASVDAAFPSQFYIAALLERGVKALLYVGANDWICNWVGNEKMSLALEWSGQEAFAAQPLRDWKVNGTTAGVTRSSGAFTFATIYGAGHMVPFDQPEVALELVQKWLAGEEL
ncbi:hypothetical protein EUX98_g7491 [Antrodiella citrinella]|uniref:Carboxypeptidase n=1 Tax=Antrodiella citrinella TaxID=2447956 RepID=A0A4S4MNA2_9APHY|nr:hypothetical protein EUX98_g7491 [Antrodiella citrinella]